MSEGPAIFPISYGIHGGRPGVDLGFEVREDGECTVDVLTPDSVEQSDPVRIGRFRTRLGEAVLQRLSKWARGTGEASRKPQPSGTTSRYLALANGEPVEVAPNDRVERDLMAAARRSLKDPLGAVEIEATGDQLVIRGLGDEAFRLVLFDNADSAYYGSVWRVDQEAEDGEAYTGSDEIDALIEQGKIPEGVVEFIEGVVVEIPLPRGKNRGATGGFRFWRAGRGQERRAITGAWSA